VSTEKFGITKVVRHLPMPGVFIEQFGITKVVRHLLVPGGSI
jgi:heat shock protein HspQ